MSRTPVIERPKTSRQRFILFLPDEIAQQVRALALAGRRPLNSQLEMLIEEGLRQETRAAA